MTEQPTQREAETVALCERLRAQQAFPVCPYDRRSPDYWTAPNDKPCVVCGGEPEGPDKCTGADTRIMLEAAALIERLERERDTQRESKEFAQRCCVKAEADNARLKDELSKQIAGAELIALENARLREALVPFAEAAASYDPPEGDDSHAAWAHDFTIGSLRRARAALPARTQEEADAE